jgi:hypothetical protein
MRTDTVIRTLADEGWERRGDVLVGPGGAYLLATKALPGRAPLDTGALTFRLRDVDETVVRFAGLRGRLLAAARRLSVRPLVVIWGDFPARAVDDDGVAYVHGDELAEWLRSRSPIPRELELAS